MDNHNNLVLDATDLQWLDVTYTAKKYLQHEQTFATTHVKKDRKTNLKKLLGFGAMAVGCLAVLLCFTFAKGNFEGNFLQIAKATVTTSVFGNKAQQTASLVVPCNMQVSSLEDGVIVLSVGKALTSLSTGTVTQVDDTSITVQVDDNLVVVYSGLVDCFVSTGDVVQNNQLLGKYDTTVSASVMYKGQLVQDVVASESSIRWDV